MNGLFFYLGFFGLLAQVGLFREFSVVFVGHELAFGFALSAWLFWTGWGSQSFHKQGAGSVDQRRLGITFILTGFAFFLSGMAVRLSKGYLPFGVIPGLFSELLLAHLFLSAPCWLMGRCFAIGCRSEYHRTRQEAAARLYTWESLGAFIGGLFYTFYLSGRISFSLFMALAGFGWTILSGMTLKPLRRSVLWYVLIVISGLLLLTHNQLDTRSRSFQWERYKILFQKESRYAHLATARLRDLTVFFENGIVSARVPDPSLTEELAHWPLLAHPRPDTMPFSKKTSLVSLPEMLKHGPKTIDYVEPDGDIIKMVGRFQSDLTPIIENTALFHSYRQDVRRWIGRSTDRYDIILPSFSEPVNMGLNRFFTREFFISARNALTQNGILAFSIPSAENYLSPELLYLDASIYKTLQSVFPHVEIIPGSRLLLLASRQQLNLDPNVLSSVYKKRNIKNRELTPALFPYILNPYRRQTTLARLEEMRKVPENTDDNPVSSFHLWRVFLSKYVSPAYFVGLAAVTILLGWLLMSLWTRRDLWLKDPAMTALSVMGFSGMVFETTLLFTVQSLYGNLYWLMGILFSSFMGGLWGGSRWGAKTNRTATIFAPLLGLTGVWSLAVAGGMTYLATIPPTYGLTIILGALLLEGFFMGAGYSITAKSRTQSGPALYSADVWGAAAGALLTGAFLVPLFGLKATFIVGGIIPLLIVPWVLSRR